MSQGSIQPDHLEPFPKKPEAKRGRWFERLSDILLGEPQDREQLIDLLRDAEQRHLLDHDALRMIEGVLRISELHVKDILVPRSQMVVVDGNSALKDFLTPLLDSGHSRFPVIGQSQDEIIGILLAKDLLRFACNGNQHEFNLAKVLRPVMFVPESKRLDALLREFRQKFTHMAIVVDEYGGAAGLVTIEDILEQIVGEIEDEYDMEDEEQNIKLHSEKTFLVRAATPISEFNKQFNVKFNEDEFASLAGFVTNLFGHLPKAEEKIKYESLEFKVLSVDKRHIRTLQVKLLS